MSVEVVSGVRRGCIEGENRTGPVRCWCLLLVVVVVRVVLVVVVLLSVMVVAVGDGGSVSSVFDGSGWQWL